MGFFNEIKKLLFGIESVSKSAAGKAFEKGKEAASSAVDASGDLMDKAKDKVEDLGEGVIETAGNIWEKAVETAEDVGGKVIDKAGDILEDARDVAEDLGEKVMDKAGKVADDLKETGSKVMDKAGDVLEDVKDVAGDVGQKAWEGAEGAVEKMKDAGGDLIEKAEDLFDSDEKESSVDDLSLTDDTPTTMTENITQATENIGKEKGDELMDQAKDQIADVGSKILATKGEIVEKAKNVVEGLGDKLDETIKKAESMAAKESSQPEYKAPSELLEKDLLEDKDDFFKKADAFADGRYDEVTDPFSDPKPKIVTGNEPVEKPSVPSTPVPGFEDLDGDGDEIIDDALLVSDDDE